MTTLRPSQEKLPDFKGKNSPLGIQGNKTKQYSALYKGEKNQIVIGLFDTNTVGFYIRPN